MIRKIILCVLVLWNLTVFFLYGVDKHKAKKDKWRVSEKMLLLCAANFGSIGALLGMRVFHHKTLHKKFTIGVPLMLAAQIALAAWLASGFR